jgi:hypothetical protein
MQDTLLGYIQATCAILRDWLLIAVLMSLVFSKMVVYLAPLETSTALTVNAITTGACI